MPKHVASKKKSSTSPLALTGVAPRLLNIKQAAAYLASHVWFIRTLVWEKKIPHLKLGNKYAFDLRDLDVFVEQTKVTR